MGKTFKQFHDIYDDYDDDAGNNKKLIREKTRRMERINKLRSSEKQLDDHDD